MSWLAQNLDSIVALATAAWAFVERGRRKRTADELQAIRVEAGTAATDLPKRRSM